MVGSVIDQITASSVYPGYYQLIGWDGSSFGFNGVQSMQRILDAGAGADDYIAAIK
jgi:hypothetical protein